MVGGSLEAGEDHGVYAHDGATVELEAVRLSGNEIGVRVLESRASLRDIVVESGRGPAVAAGQGATVVVHGGELEAGEYAALEAFDGGHITAAGCVCRTDDDPTLAYDGGTVELLAWIVALGAAGGRAAQTDFYVPSVPLRCGMGGVSWAV